MKKIIDAIQSEWQCNRAVLLITIIKKYGSSPRGVGAQMLVGRQGILCGTVGGGRVEQEAVQEALRLLEEKQSARKYYALNMQEPESIGMVCGGSVDLHFLYLDGQSEASSRTVEEVAERIEHQQKGYLCLDTRDHRIWVTDQKECGEPSEPVLSLPIPIPTRVVIFGGGHVAQALVPILASVSFCCVVVENREIFAAKEVFPLAKEVFLGDYSDVEATIQLRPEDFIVVVTHGHMHDYTVLNQVLRERHAYVGLMGSRKKIAALNERLRNEGIAEDRIKSLHTPIGLSIGAVTPAEIAVSIAAECIQVRALSNEDGEKKVCPSSL